MNGFDFEFENDATQEKSRKFAQYFNPGDEKVRVRFLLAPTKKDEKTGKEIPLHKNPLIILSHAVNLGSFFGNREWAICSKPTTGKCVFCLMANKDPGTVEYAKNRYVFNLIDTRKFHLVSEGDKKKRRFCTGHSCKECRSGNFPKIVGPAYWSVGKPTANQLGSLHAGLLEKCVCGRGKISIKEFECPVCEGVVPYDPEVGPEITHGVCGKAVRLQEIIACSASCPGPTRGSINGCYISVERIPPFSFAFLADFFSDLEEPHKAYVPYDLREIFKPLSPDEQAEKIGVANPYSVEGVVEIKTPSEDLPF